MKTIQSSEASFSSPESAEPEQITQESESKPENITPPWPAFISSANYQQIRSRFVQELTEALKPFRAVLKGTCCIALMAPSGDDSISEFYTDRIFTALRSANPKKDKDVLLVLGTRGGSIEPAFQISKLCKSYAKSKFTVAIPRRAKSAGTLIAIGADEIHLGELGQLGPIDPQLRGLPALGVAPALERIAQLSEKYPGSADMFARYLRLTLSVEEIGYYERISQSAVQYAELLLATKPSLTEKKSGIAQALVYGFKDHGFVINSEEAQRILGTEWIRTESPQLKLAEVIYSQFEQVDLFLTILQKKRLLLIGDLTSEPLIFDNKQA